MKARIILMAVLAALIATSCTEKGTLVVTNKVSNAKIESISFDDYPIYGELLPGQSSEKLEIKELKDKFPFTGPIEFYMTSGSKKVYLKTKQSFQLDYDQDLVVVITDSTEVINPALE
ncbi:MAG: hypothetical protein RBS07_10025 [Lentimicrobium sp.]|jgi:hypothetical protein|nr:hypothetical protein [Lentimicrobium sp.]